MAWHGKLSRDEIKERVSRALLSGKFDDCDDIFGADAPIFDMESRDFPHRAQARPYKPNAYSAPFHRDLDAKVKVAISPLGTGTTTMCVMDAMVYRPLKLFLPNARRQGLKVVTAPWLVLRKTKEQAIQTFWETFTAICPNFVKAEWKGSQNEMVTWMEGDDGVVCRTVFRFESYDLTPMTARDRFQSTRPCGVLVVEYGACRSDVLSHLYSRVGRHDSGHNSPTPGVMLLEGNMPPPNAEIHQFYGGYPSSEIIGVAEPRRLGLKDQQPQGYCYTVPKGRRVDGTEFVDTRRVYHAPAGDCKHAQNLENTPDYTPQDPNLYYRKMMADPVRLKSWRIYGIGAATGEGYPAFPAFSRQTHIVPSSAIFYPQHGADVVVTYDQGLSGGAILWIHTSDGLVAYRSCTANGVGARAFSHDIADMFRGIKVRTAQAVGDPVSRARDSILEGVTYASALTESVSERLGRPVRFQPLPAKDNSIKMRVDNSEEMLRSTRAHGTARRLMFSEDVSDVINAMEEYQLRNEPQFNDRMQFIKNNDVTSALGDCVTYAAMFLANARVSDEEDELVRYGSPSHRERAEEEKGKRRFTIDTGY